MTATDLVPLLVLAQSDESVGAENVVMPFVLLAVLLVLAALLLFVLGRQRRRNRDHQG